MKISFSFPEESTRETLEAHSHLLLDSSTLANTVRTSFESNEQRDTQSRFFTRNLFLFSETLAHSKSNIIRSCNLYTHRSTTIVHRRAPAVTMLWPNDIRYRRSLSPAFVRPSVIAKRSKSRRRPHPRQFFSLPLAKVNYSGIGETSWSLIYGGGGLFQSESR